MRKRGDMADPEHSDSDAPCAPTESEEDESLYSPEYLRECASGDARKERLDELKRRIQHGAYRVEAERVADELLQREDLDSE